ncbi:TPA: O-antigen ligase family protein [Photobacterium damselae]
MHLLYRKRLTFNYVLSVFLLFPIPFSIIFSLFNINIPAYGICIIVSSFILMLGVDSKARNIFLNKGFLCIFVFFIWIIYSYSYSLSIFYSGVKLYNIIYNTIIPIIILSIAAIFTSSVTTHDSLIFDYSLSRMAKFLLCIMSIAMVVFGLSGNNGRMVIPGVDNPIWLSRYIGLLLLILLITSTLKFKKYISDLPFIFIGLLLLFMAGSRTPIVALLLVFFVFVYRWKGFIFLVPYVSFFMGLIFLGFLYSDNYIFDTDFYSIIHRIDFFNEVFLYKEKILQGYGLGSFGVVVFGQDIVVYPHNIFLEIFFEFGIVGVCLFLLVIFNFIKGFSDSLYEYLTIYALVLSFTSGDIPGNNMLFILLFFSFYYRSYIRGTI